MLNGDIINSSYILVYRLCALSVIIHLLIIIRHEGGQSFTLSPAVTFGTEKIKKTFRTRVFTLPFLHTSLGDGN